MQSFFDSHIHTSFSPDSQQPLFQICRKAKEKGLQGISITDHADILWELGKTRILENLAQSISEARVENTRYEGELRVFCGVELADPLDDVYHTRNVLALTNYDVVLGSVHAASDEEWGDIFYSKIAFDSASDAVLDEFMQSYYRKVLFTAEYADYDVLSHLTCPLRYINGKYGRNVDNSIYMALIREILKILIHRQKALEVNTSGIHSFYGELMPDRHIIRQYFDMGGRLITLGSDAHTADRVGNAFPEMAQMLKEIGFREYHYYEQRKPQSVPWLDSI